MQALTRAMSAVAHDHVEQVMQARAIRLVEALKGDKAAAEKLAQVML